MFPVRSLRSSGLFYWTVTCSRRLRYLRYASFYYLLYWYTLEERHRICTWNWRKQYFPILGRYCQTSSRIRTLNGKLIPWQVPSLCLHCSSGGNGFGVYRCHSDVVTGRNVYLWHFRHHRMCLPPRWVHRWWNGLPTSWMRLCHYLNHRSGRQSFGVSVGRWSQSSAICWF